MRALEIVEVLPLSELGVEDGVVVYDHTLEQAIELLIVDSVRALYLAIEAGHQRFDVDVPDAAVA